ncbi:GDCCVxC domain-containing (seleno)protein [Lysobacter humi (ex Lee et al. 2017)]
MPVEVQLSCVLTCPTCEHRSVQTMPETACQYFHECAACGAIASPKPGNCCVFCSYGTVACPPVQLDAPCCAGPTARIV